jgi:hypothetical protein
LSAQLRQGCAVHALGAEHIDVEEFGVLLWREGLGRAEHHMARVVHDHVDPAVCRDDFGDCGVRRFLRLHVQLDRAQVDAVLPGIVVGGLDLGCVAVRGCAHAGVDRVAGTRQGAGAQCAEAAGCAGDENDLLHGNLLCGCYADIAARGKDVSVRQSRR